VSVVTSQFTLSIHSQARQVAPTHAVCMAWCGYVFLIIKSWYSDLI